MFGEIFDLINSSNILVLKCFKYIFKHFSRSIGGWISLFLILAQIAMVLLYFLKEIGVLKANLLNLVKNYLEYISEKNNEKNDNPPKRNLGLGNIKNYSGNNIIISNAIDNLEVKSNNIKIPNKRLEKLNNEDNKIIPF